MKVNQKSLRNSGVALVTVLVITAVTLALGYAALTISLSVLQGSKSAEHSVQARMNAESGLDAVLIFLEDRFSEHKNTEAGDVVIPKIVSASGNLLDSGVDYSFSGPGIPEFIDKFSVNLSIDGKALGGATYMTSAQVYYEPGEGEAGPNIENPVSIITQLYRGISACGTMGIAAGGQILGDGNVFAKENVTISGGTLIKGNLYTLGSFRSVESALVSGSLFALGNVTIGANSVRYGDIWSEQNVTLSGTVNVGSIYSNGKISFPGWSSRVYGEVNAGLNVEYLNRVTIDIEPVQQGLGNFVDLNFDICDVDPITTEVNFIKSNIVNSNINVDAYNEQNMYWDLTPNSISSYKGVSNQGGVIQKLGFISYSVTPTMINFLDSPTPVMRVSSFNVDQNGVIRVFGGDVTLFVDNPISILRPGGLVIDSDSSLTIITPQRISLTEGGGSPGWNVINDLGVPSLRFFTSYTSETTDGFYATGGQEMRALVYSPNSPISLVSGAQLTGAAVGKNITLSGGAKLEFDKGLLDLITEIDPSATEGGLVVVKRR